MKTNIAFVLLTPIAACSADVPAVAKHADFNLHRANVSAVDTALAYGESLVGTPYGWWFGGPLPGGEPMFTDSGPAPDAYDVGSVNCSGLMNLLLRSIGSDPVGGTAAYYATYYDSSEWFDPYASYPAGTLLIRNYYDVYDQGHVAVVTGAGTLLQSYASCYGCSYPGVDDSLTVADTNAWASYGNYFDLAVRPENWLGEIAGCPSGDGNYCGGDGVDGDPATLYACTGGQLTPIETCALGCQYNDSGTDDTCNTSCPFGDGMYCGGDGIGGDAATLYQCAAGTVTAIEQCANGCDARPAGYDDACL